MPSILGAGCGQDHETVFLVVGGEFAPACVLMSRLPCRCRSRHAGAGAIPVSEHIEIAKVFRCDKIVNQGAVTGNPRARGLTVNISSLLLPVHVCTNNHLANIIPHQNQTRMYTLQVQPPRPPTNRRLVRVIFSLLLSPKQCRSQRRPNHVCIVSPKTPNPTPRLKQCLEKDQPFCAPHIHIKFRLCLRFCCQSGFPSSVLPCVPSPASPVATSSLYPPSCCP